MGLRRPSGKRPGFAYDSLLNIHNVYVYTAPVWLRPDPRLVTVGGTRRNDKNNAHLPRRARVLCIRPQKTTAYVK